MEWTQKEELAAFRKFEKEHPDQVSAHGCARINGKWTTPLTRLRLFSSPMPLTKIAHLMKKKEDPIVPKAPENNQDTPLKQFPKFKPPNQRLRNLKIQQTTNIAPSPTGVPIVPIRPVTTPVPFRFQQRSTPNK